jgi:hypothetical protein
MDFYPEWWRQKFLVVEFWISILVASGLFVWWEYGDATKVLTDIVKGNRSTIYGTMASLSGSLLGFVIATQSIVLGFSGSERLKILRNSKYYEQLWKVFTSSIRVLGSTTLLWLVALFFDRETSSRPLLLICCLAVTFLALLRLARCVWVLERIVEALTVKNGPVDSALQ